MAPVTKSSADGAEGSDIPNAEAVIEVRVAELKREADGVVSLRLCSSDGTPLPGWSCGAHIDVILPGGVERQYSLCGDADDAASWRVAVLREPESRGGSSFIHDELRAGDRLSVRGPRNNFPLLDADDYRFVAGGIGITPLLPMIAAVNARGASWRLLYGGRARASMAFLDELAGYEAVEVRPQDEFGLLDLDSFLADVGETTHVYACGPEPLIQAVETQATGWAPETLRVERFRPREGALDGPERPLVVVLEQTGLTVDVPAGVSILDAVEATGAFVPASCREGTCGTCETVVLSGVPDHRDSVLTDEQRASNTVMMICCSRARSDRLTLDL